LLLLLLDYWPLDRLARRSFWRRLREKLPLFALAALGAAIALAVQAGGYRGALSLPDRLANALVSYARYLGKTLWPRDLAVLYPHPYISEYGLPPWTALEVAGAAALLAALTSLALRRRYSTVGWLWFVATLVPVIGLVQHAPIAMADRYTYLPLIGLFVGAVWAGSELAEHSARSWRGVRTIAWLAAATLLVACGIAARAQLAHWRDSPSLFRHALDVAPENQETLFLLASSLAQRGQEVAAIELYERALEIGEGHAELHYNLAGAHARRGDLERAARHYRRALASPRRHPYSQFGDAQIHFNLGVSLASLGRHADAVPHFAQAIQAGMGRSLAARIALADARYLSGDAAGALLDYQAALALDPASERAQRGVDRSRASTAP
jgi:tetratricopeptide (TPR) repeat protein